MESLYLLLPMSVLLVLAVIGVFAWALHSGQFDDLEREGWRALDLPPPAKSPDLDSDQIRASGELDPDQP